ncbi:MAG: hypothetical protein NTX42_11510 [Methanothrix sp.]|nr:hypothetical protein [Methanothrix sp.]
MALWSSTYSDVIRLSAVSTPPARRPLAPDSPARLRTLFAIGKHCQNGLLVHSVPLNRLDNITRTKKVKCDGDFRRTALKDLAKRQDP